MDQPAPASSTPDTPVVVVLDGGVLHLWFNRPAALNALDERVAAAFRDACLEARDIAGARVLVIAGKGRGFMAGGDLKRFHEVPDQGPEVADAIIASLNEALLVLEALDIPVIASVHGPVAGAGMSLALAADLCIAADDAIFSLAYTRIGATLDGSASHHLPRLVGTRKAMELALLADPVDAREALRLGLVNRVVPAGELDVQTRALATRLADGPTGAFAGIRHLLRRSWETPLDRQLDAERVCFTRTAATADFREGIDAFLGRRPPRFRGC